MKIEDNWYLISVILIIIAGLIGIIGGSINSVQGL